MELAAEWTARRELREELILPTKEVLPGRPLLGKWLFRLASALLIAVALVQILHTLGIVPIGFTDWRPTLYAYLLWAWRSARARC